MVEKCSLQLCVMHFAQAVCVCQHSRQGQYAMPDDADILIQKMAAADVIAFGNTGIFKKCGQMKTLLDRQIRCFRSPL